MAIINLQTADHAVFMKPDGTTEMFSSSPDFVAARSWYVKHDNKQLIIDQVRAARGGLD